MAEDVPTLKFRKVYANFTEASLVGGFKYIFKSFCSEYLETLEVKLNHYDAGFDELLDLLDRLSFLNLKSLSIIWESYILSPEEHFQFSEKISKLNIKKLIIVMNENFVKY